MRKHSRLFGFGLVCLFALGGCIPSLHPLYTPADLIFDPALVGEWGEKDEPQGWTFSKTGDKEYKAVYLDSNGKRGKFVAHLLKVEGRMFLDFFPADPELKENDFYKIHLVPAHTFMRVRQIGPALQLAMLKPDKLKTYLEANPTAVRHETAEGGLVFTAPTKELQAFVIKSESIDGLWDDGKPLPRRAAAAVVPAAPPVPVKAATPATTPATPVPR